MQPSLIIDKPKECNKIVLRDSTIYGDMEDVFNISLKIKAPGEEEWYNILVEPGWCSTIISSEQLGLDCIEDCEGTLPDGIYEINYILNEENSLYYHMRVCSLWNKYLDKLCELINSKCETSQQKYKYSLEKMWRIRNLIEDAVILVEDCLDIKKGTELYNDILSQLNKENDCLC